MSITIDITLNQKIDPDLLRYPVDMVILPDYLRTQDRFPRAYSQDYRTMKDYHAFGFSPPDQMNRFDDDWVPLTYDTQWLIFDACNLRAYGKPFAQMNSTEKKIAKKEWLSFVWDGRCYTNGMSYDSGYECFITGANKGSSKGPIQWESVHCSTNIVRVIDRPEWRRTQYPGAPLGRYLHAPIETMITNRLPDLSTFLASPHLCHYRSVISTSKYLSDGNFKMELFPQFGGNACAPVLSKTGVGWFRWDWLALPA